MIVYLIYKVSSKKKKDIKPFIFLNPYLDQKVHLHKKTASIFHVLTTWDDVAVTFPWDILCFMLLYFCIFYYFIYFKFSQGLSCSLTLPPWRVLQMPDTSEYWVRGFCQLIVVFICMLLFGDLGYQNANTVCHCFTQLIKA